MSKWIYNDSGSTKTYIGQDIADEAYFMIPSDKEPTWAKCSELLADILNSQSGVVMSKTNDSSGHITDGSDGIDFLKGVASASDIDNRKIVHSTPRYLGTYTYFTGSDDDHTDPHAVGGDTNVTSLEWDHAVDGDNPEVIYMDFNTINNDTYVRQGDLMWKDAENDHLTFEMVPKLTDYTSGSNTNYNLYGGYLIIPAAGDGTISVAANDIVLVQNTPNEFGDMPAGYWDATWNTTTKTFDDITANTSGTGEFNMFGLEVVLFRFMNKRHLLGTGRKDCVTEDVSQLGHGIRMKISAATVGTDHAWSGNATLMMYRKKTC